MHINDLMIKTTCLDNENRKIQRILFTRGSYPIFLYNLQCYSHVFLNKGECVEKEHS